MNAFGNISVVFRLLEPETAEKIALTATYQHNFLRRSDTSNERHTPRGTCDTEHTMTHKTYSRTAENGRIVSRNTSFYTRPDKTVGVGFTNKTGTYTLLYKHLSKDRCL